MSSDIALKVDGLAKCYHIYDEPGDRLKQFVMPRARKLLHQPQRNYFREFWALKNVSFEIRKGEVVGIVGRNGSGKSTLLQLICGTLNPTRGNIQTSGKIAALLELGSGFNPEFTGRENVYLNGAVLGLSKDDIASRFDQILAFADIGEFIDQPVKNYSSGMVVRLAFSVAIHVEPQILVVDEALSVGDELFQRKCFSRIEAIRAAGATILFVSHSGGTVVELCDRAILLDAGEQLAIGTPKHIIGVYQKLLYAPDDRRALIRAQIRDEQSKVVGETDDKSAGTDLSATTEQQHGNAELPDTFDPELTPSSTITYESYGAHITSPSIHTPDGEQVNNLTKNKRYRYRYQVRFDRAANFVRFGMLIKTTSGVELGGAVSAQSNRSSLPFVEAGSTYQIEFEFDCNLNPGTYFMNAGVVGDLHGTETYLHRIVDAAMFRVMAESNRTATGIIDFACVPHIKQTSVT